MSEQVLERSERHVRLRHAPAKGVTKLMASDLNTRFLTVTLQDELNTVDRESFSALGNENRPIICDRAPSVPIIVRHVQSII